MGPNTAASQCPTIEFAREEQLIQCQMRIHERFNEVPFTALMNLVGSDAVTGCYAVIGVCVNIATQC